MTRQFLLGSLTAALLLVGINTAAQTASCAREDVDYYLGKGFSQEQITAICSGAPQVIERVTVQPAVPPAQPVQAPLAQAVVSAPANDDAQFLSLAIDGYDVALSEKSLAYTRETCVKYGERDQGGFRERFCSSVRYDIGREGMKVLDTNKKFLIYGNDKIIVSGTIERKILDSVDDLKPVARKEIMKAIEQGPSTEIPVRSGIPLDRVALTLKRLAI